MSNEVNHENLKTPASKEFIRIEIQNLRRNIPEMIEKYGKQTLIPAISQAVRDGLAPYQHLLASKGDKQAENIATNEVEKASVTAQNERRLNSVVNWIEKAAHKIGIPFNNAE